jgi:hypothetical protein
MNRDAGQASLIRRCSAGVGGRSSGERWFAAPIDQVVSDLHGKCVLFLLKPDKLGLKIANTLLEATHLTDHAEIRPADVAE